MAWKPGQQVGGYTLVARLASGGMATTFLGRRASAAGFARDVVLKAVHPHLAVDPSFVAMFVEEALLSARVQHPNVVHVEELIEYEGAYALVMEYVPGISLAHLLESLGTMGRRLAPETAVAIAVQVADGLHAAHEARGDDGEPLGVVHRDVSPQNVLLSRAGYVKLIDFGIAKARGRSSNTLVGTVRGKVRYMAPEQAGETAIDRRTDIYALGVVLWEMLAGRRLHEAASDVELLARVRTPVIEPPSRFAPGLPASLDAVVMAALAPEPAARPATALELRYRLAEALPRALVVGPSQLAGLVAATGVDAAHATPRDPFAAMAQDATADVPPAAASAAVATLTVVLDARSSAPPPRAPTPKAAADAPPRRWMLTAFALSVIAGGSLAVVFQLAQRTQAESAAARPAAMPTLPMATARVGAEGSTVATSAPPTPEVISVVARPTTVPTAGAATESITLPSTSATSRSESPTRRHRRRRPSHGVPFVSDPGI